MADLDSPLIMKPGEGEQVTIGGASLRIIIPSIATDDAYSLHEIVLKRGAEIPETTLGWHRLLYWIVEGSFKFRVAARTALVSPGAALSVPPGTAHSYQSISDTGGRILVYALPGGFDDYIRDMGAILAGSDQTTGVNELNIKYQISFR